MPIAVSFGVQNKMKITEIVDTFEDIDTAKFEMS